MGIIRDIVKLLKDHHARKVQERNSKKPFSFTLYQAPDKPLYILEGYFQDGHPFDLRHMKIKQFCLSHTNMCLSAKLKAPSNIEVCLEVDLPCIDASREICQGENLLWDWGYCAQLNECGFSLRLHQRDGVRGVNNIHITFSVGKKPSRCLTYNCQFILPRLSFTFQEKVYNIVCPLDRFYGFWKRTSCFSCLNVYIHCSESDLPLRFSELCHVEGVQWELFNRRENIEKMGDLIISEKGNYTLCLNLSNYKCLMVFLDVTISEGLSKVTYMAKSDFRGWEVSDEIKQRYAEEISSIPSNVFLIPQLTPDDIYEFPLHNF